jgi:hypothetical protein
MTLTLLLSSCSDNSHSALKTSNEIILEHSQENINAEPVKLRYTSPTPEQIEKILRRAAAKKSALNQ